MRSIQTGHLGQFRREPFFLAARDWPVAIWIRPNLNALQQTHHVAKLVANFLFEPPVAQGYVSRPYLAFLDGLTFEMGWLDSIWGRRSDDPLQDFDPKVREFLKKESPIKYDKKPGQDAQKHQVAEEPPSGTAATTAARSEAAPNAVPREALYQDGRYAHLWKTYRPLAEVEGETKSDHEKLQDVLDAFKSRKAAIGAAALENCAEEQLDWNNCMKSGSLRARMTMCRDEVRKFEKCYNMQSVSQFHWRS